MARRESRVFVSDKTVDTILGEIRDKISAAMTNKDSYSYISTHECYGKIIEEVDELLKALRKNDDVNFEEELFDIIIASLFSIASMRTNK